MKRMINYFWNPEIKTVQGFKYASYLSLAPVLLLNFILPGLIVFGFLLIFFILKSLVSIREAITHDIDAEKRGKYHGNYSATKRTYVIFCTMTVIFVAGAVFLYIITGGLLGALLTILISTITLPILNRQTKVTTEEIVHISGRKEKGRTSRKTLTAITVAFRKFFFNITLNFPESLQEKYDQS